jgi:hypothetical protein
MQLLQKDRKVYRVSLTIPLVRLDPMFDPIRNDPGFLNLPVVSRSQVRFCMAQINTIFPPNLSDTRRALVPGNLAPEI